MKNKVLKEDHSTSLFLVNSEVTKLKSRIEVHRNSLLHTLVVLPNSIVDTLNLPHVYNLRQL